MQDEYLIPQEIKSETYFGRGMYFFDLAFIAMWYMIMSLFEDIVDPRVRIIYMGLNVIVPAILTRRSTKNPEKRIYESIIISFFMSRETKYHNKYENAGEVTYEKEAY